MNKMFLELSQMLEEHPIRKEKTAYKIKYINVLEYFVRKYSKDDIWANAELRLYIKKLIGNKEEYQYDDFKWPKELKRVIATKFKPFKFFTYRYCLIFDCIFINAIDNEEKGEKIFAELSEVYSERYWKKIRQVFDFLYDPTVSVDGIDRIQYMKDCWNKNRLFLAREPTKVIIIANMSAGKSTLLNALVGKKVNKTQNAACTAKIHYIVNKAFEDKLCYEYDYLLELDADYNTLMEDNKDNKSVEITVGTYFRTVSSPEKRLWLIDTPGVNYFYGRDHKDIAESAIKSVDADLLICLLDGTNTETNDEENHLQFILKNYQGKVLFVVNKLDKFQQREDSVSETLREKINALKVIGFVDPCVVPISSYAAYLAKMKIFGGQLDEDEQDELDRMSRKLRKEEYQFDTYYPDDIQETAHIDSDDENVQLLMHSGILQLENIIYKMR